MIADKEDFVEQFGMVNEDVTRSLLSNSGCELKFNLDGSARIANGLIYIDQTDSGRTTYISLDLSLYPLRANFGNKGTVTQDREELVRTYARVFTASLKKAILSAEQPTRVGWRG